MAAARAKSPKSTTKPAVQKRAKPLSEQLAELFDPTPKGAHPSFWLLTHTALSTDNVSSPTLDYDPEQLDINVGEETDPAVWEDGASDAEIGDDAPAAAPAVAKRLALRADIDMGAKYAGKRATRASFLEVSPQENDADDSLSASDEDGQVSRHQIDNDEDESDSQTVCLPDFRATHV